MVVTDELGKIFMLASHFDTHRYIKKLTARNFTEDQAEALVDLTIEVVEVKNADTISRAEDTVFKSEMKADFAGLRNDIDARFSEFRKDVEVRFANVDTKFANIEAKFDTKFANVEAKFAHVDTKFANLESRIIKWIVGVGISVGAIIIGLLVTILTRLPH